MCQSVSQWSTDLKATRQMAEAWPKEEAARTSTGMTSLCSRYTAGIGPDSPYRRMPAPTLHRPTDGQKDRMVSDGLVVAWECRLDRPEPGCRATNGRRIGRSAPSPATSDALVSARSRRVVPREQRSAASAGMVSGGPVAGPVGPSRLRRTAPINAYARAHGPTRVYGLCGRGYRLQAQDQLVTAPCTSVRPQVVGRCSQASCPIFS